ncbi:uracil-DNA glycosylase, partial [Candidatus Nitromaritima sp. SCGC AAA799-A02]
FELLLHHAGLTREDIFITNAVLCNPLREGNNRRPTAKEIGNCSSFLKEVINIVSPRVISTLGGVGLDAMNRLLGTRYKLAATAACPILANGFTLFPLYHPSPRVVHTRRSLTRQKRDFKMLVETLSAMAA